MFVLLQIYRKNEIYEPYMISNQVIDTLKLFDLFSVLFRLVGF